MNIIKHLLITLLISLGLSSATFACDCELKITEAWARQSMHSKSNSAAYMVIENTSDKPWEIIGTLTNVSEKTELHETYLDENKVSRMASVDKIVVPANSKIELKPGGTHIMLMSLKKELKLGDKFTITLRLKDHESRDVEVEVRDPSKSKQ